MKIAIITICIVFFCVHNTEAFRGDVFLSLFINKPKPPTTQATTTEATIAEENARQTTKRTQKELSQKVRTACSKYCGPGDEDKLCVGSPQEKRLCVLCRVTLDCKFGKGMPI